MRMDLGMRSTSHYDSMPCMTVASLEMSDEPKKQQTSRAHIRIFFPRKKHSLLHRQVVFPWFSSILSVKALIFNPSHGWLIILLFICWFSVVFRCERLQFQPFTQLLLRCEWYLLRCECFSCGVNTWKTKPSHSNRLKVRGKRAECEGVNAFFAH